MDLKQRLRLRRKLRRLGRGPGAASRAEPYRAPRGQHGGFSPDGQEVLTPLGSVYVREAVYDAAHVHGQFPLGALNEAPMSAVGELTDPPLLETPTPAQLVFLDTETTGLEGGTGTWVFLIGMAHLFEGGVRVRQYFLRDLDEEPALLALLAEDLEAIQARVLVTYNGLAFDVPMLETRYILNAMHCPLTDLAHLDLLVYTRKIWRPRLGRVSLANVEARLLRHHRDILDVPGWLVPDLYREYLNTGRWEPLVPVFYHNEQDVLSLVVLTTLLLSCWVDPWSHPALTPDDMVAQAQLLLEKGAVEDAEALLYYAARQARTPHLRHRAFVRLSRLLKRERRWQQAVALWEEWAASMPVPDVTPFEELAKYYEWQAGDFEQALYWVEAALAHVPHLPPAVRERSEQALMHRRERLRQRLARKGQRTG